MVRTDCNVSSCACIVISSRLDTPLKPIWGMEKIGCSDKIVSKEVGATSLESVTDKLSSGLSTDEEYDLESLATPAKNSY